MISIARVCDEFGHHHAGYRPTPRSYCDIKERPDEELWMQACNKEIKKLFDMGTFTIVRTPVTCQQEAKRLTVACRPKSRRTQSGSFWNIG
jgi:hypothetical protein